MERLQREEWAELGVMSSERQCRLRHGVGECLMDALLCEGDCPLRTRARYTRKGGLHMLRAR